MSAYARIGSSALSLAVAAVVAGGAWTLAQPSPATSPAAPAGESSLLTPVAPKADAPKPDVSISGPTDAATPAAPDAPQPNTPPADAAAKISPQELDGLLAPIALYPDTVLSQALMASTYPLEVVQARRWLAENPTLAGDALADALAKQPWDPSVKSLINVPTVLQLLDEKLEWTIRLGDAFLAQQRDVMDSVQRLRATAQAAGFLKSDEQQRVTREPAAPTPAPSAPAPTPAAGPYASADSPYGPAVQAPPPEPIVIETTQTEVVYVPVYDPGVVYGTWAYADYRPFYWRPARYTNSAPYFYDRPCAVGPAWSYAWGRPDWRVRRLDLNFSRYPIVNSRLDRDESVRRVRERTQNRPAAQANAPVVWQHDSVHRLGVPYPAGAVTSRGNRATADAPRRDTTARGDANRNDRDRDRTDAARARIDADRARTADARAADANSSANAKSADAARNGSRRTDANRADQNRDNTNRNNTRGDAATPGAAGTAAARRSPVIPGAVAPNVDNRGAALPGANPANANGRGNNGGQDQPGANPANANGRGNDGGQPQPGANPANANGRPAAPAKAEDNRRDSTPAPGDAVERPARE